MHLFTLTVLLCTKCCLHSHCDLSTLSGLCCVLQPPEQPSMHDMTYLHPVGLAEAGADTGSKGTSRHTADHYRHALLTGVVALQLYLTAQLTIRQVSLVAGAVDRETPVVLLTTLGQQSGKIQYKIQYKLL